MQDEITVSYVVTVYNKEPYVGYTAQSLLGQEGGISREYIFVDDVSSDRSLEVIEEQTKGVANVVIIRNSANAGPSVRLNQGAKLARGKYLQFIDSDDIMAANATAMMLSLAERNEAEVVYGRWEKTGIESAKLLGRRVPENAKHELTDEPLAFLFYERLLRMTQLVRRDTFMASGGCDERVFIQDESLALRLARVARRFAVLDAPVVLVPKVEGELSRNVSQLNHDRYLAYANMLLDFPELDDHLRRLLYRNCVSAYWKEHRHVLGKPRAVASRIFLEYLRSKCSLQPVDMAHLKTMSEFFSHTKNILRTTYVSY